MKKVIYFILVSLLAFTSCKKDASNPVNTDTIPPPPILSTPNDTSSNIAVPVVLTWKESSGAKSYTLQVSASSSFSSFVFNKSDITTTTQQVPDTNYLKIYYWRVNASNSSGTSDWSKVWSFTTTGEAAFIPALYQPYNGAVGQKITPNLTWTHVGNASRYTLQISTNSSFTNLVFDSDSLIETSINITSLSGSTKYYWHVKADNNFGSKGWTETWTFTTGVEPVPPVLLSPSDGALDISLSPMLSWNASSGATSYNMQVATANSFADSSLILNANVGNNLSRQLNSLSESKTYYWKIATLNSYGTSGWSSVWSFTTGSRPAIPLLSSPANGATEQSLSPTLSWNTSTGATNYKLQVSTNNSFTTYVYNQIDLTNTIQQLSGLSPTTIYYWRVCSINNLGTSAYSTVWSFTTTGIAPIAPTLNNPTNGATDQSISPTLNWNNSNSATSYNLQVAIDNAFSVSSLVLNENVGNATNKKLNNLNFAKTYYWKVASVNGYGTSSWSSVWAFTTGTPPEIPMLSSPVDGATDILLTPTLTWNAGSGATSYTLQVSTNNSFSNYVYNQSNLINTTKQITGLLPTTIYFWRVSSTNSFSTSEYSAIWSFTTGTPPNPPTLKAPTDGAIDVLLSATITWNASSGATSYSLQVATDNLFSNIVYNQNSLINTFQQLLVLKNATKYYWHVKAVNSFGSSAWSNVWPFSTISVCAETKTVFYANKTYNTVAIGSQCWLKENLDVGTMVQGVVNQSNNGTIEKYCYGNNAENCSTYGGLYQWNEAMTYSTIAGVKGICPTGWHIPTQAEFQTLKTTVNDNGNALKAVGQGSGSGVGTNTSGFSALLAGCRSTSGTSNYLEYYTYFWSSTEYGATAAYPLYMPHDGSSIYLFNNYKDDGYSIRCLKD